MEIEGHARRLEQLGAERGWEACKTAASILVLDLVGKLLEGALDPVWFYGEFRRRFPTIAEYYAAAAVAEE